MFSLIIGRCTTPQLFEALMFVKINSRFWDAALVEEAIGELERKEHRLITWRTEFGMMILIRRVVQILR